MKGVEIPFYEKKDKIVQISSFFQVTIAVTEAGKVFAVGEKLTKMISMEISLTFVELENPKFGFYELPLVPDQVVEEAKKPDQQESAPSEVGAPEMIDTSSVAKKAELFAIRVWACKSATATEFVQMVQVQNSMTNKLELRTLGHSQFGNLGQGVDIKTSTSFKKVELPEGIEPRSPDDVTVGYDNTFMVANDGSVWGWGSYCPDDKHQFKPVQVKYFENYDVLKIAGW